MTFVQDCEYELELNAHSEAMLAWRYGLVGKLENGRNTVTGFFKKQLGKVDGRAECIFALDGCSRVRLVIEGDSVITALPSLESFASPDAQQIVAMMEGVRVLSPLLLSAADIVGLRKEIVESNRAPEKDVFRRRLRKFLKGVDVVNVITGCEQSKGFVSAEQPIGVQASDEAPLVEELPYERLLQMSPEELEEIAEIGIPDQNRLVRYWDKDESLKILAVEGVRVIYSGELENSDSYRVFYEHQGSVYRLHTIWPKAVSNYAAGASVIYVKDYGSDEHLYVENPVPHIEYEEGLLEAS
jgi:hypothetical protein